MTTPPTTPPPLTEARTSLQEAVDAVNRPRTWDTDDTAEDWACDAMALAEAARAFLAALDAAGQTPACDHADGSTTYLRDGVFSDTCDTCGEVLTARTLAQVEAAAPGFTAATTRVGETSLPTPPGPGPTPITEEEDDEGCPECDEIAVTDAGRCLNCDYLVTPRPVGNGWPAGWYPGTD